MNEALRQAAAWRTRVPDHPIWVLVNVVSVTTSCPKGLLSYLAEILAANQLDPGALAPEVKERDVFDDPYGLVRERLDTIQRAGIGVVVDDFGNAHAALMSALEAWPPNVMKIYPAFVAQVAMQAYEATVANMNALRTGPSTSSNSTERFWTVCSPTRGPRPLVDGLVRLARSLGLRTLATSIESPNEARQLCHLGCDMAQGYYYFHRPRTPSTSTSSSPSRTKSRRGRPACPATRRSTPERPDETKASRARSPLVAGPPGGDEPTNTA